jgi:branched-chain amino acid transport system substrate-binding protein
MNSFTSSARRHRRTALSAAAVAVTLLTAAACGSGSSGGSSGGSDTIKVAQITTISGGFPFGDTVKGTKSYFNMVNADGGVNGKKIEFTSGDDKGQASEAAQLARKFVLQDKVVAMVGNTSLADCDTNKGFYESRKLAVIGGGTQPACFTQKNWAPVNSGPYVGHIVQWQYLFDVIKPKSVCEIEQNDPTSIPYYDQLREWYKGENPNAKFTQVTYTNDATQNPTPAVTAAKQKGCDAVTLSTVAPNAVAFVKAAKSVGLDATFIILGSAYDASVPGALGKLAEPGGLGPKSKGFFVGAELAKIDAEIPQVQEMVKQFEKDKTPANFWSEIGWVSAATFVDGLKQDKKAKTSTSAGVLAALQAMEPYESGFAATKLTFGDGDTHSPNKGAQMLTIKDSKWVIAEGQNAGDYTTVPDLPAPKK